MTSSSGNVAASVHARLLNRARATGEDFQFLLQRYAAERFLYRLGESAHRENYVLKGAMLFALWGGLAYRPTRDLDFTGYGDSNSDAVLECIREVCDLVVEDDGLTFDTASLAMESIRDETEYGGFRMIFQARLGPARIQMQIDVGFANAIQPAPNDVEYPTLLDAPTPHIRAYPHEAVIAEKLHAMVVRGESNSRLKDFYDLHALATQFPFDGARLAGAVAATFERRRTAIVDTVQPAALTSRFYVDMGRAAQWRAYLTRNRLPGISADFDMVGEVLRMFLVPLWETLAVGGVFSGAWQVATGWMQTQHQVESTS